MSATGQQAQTADQQGNGERDMDTKQGTPALNKALAAVQAAMPKVEKSQEGKVEGQNKDGRRYSYSYKYADLADLSAIMLPLLGKHGLAFTAKPGLDGEGRFGLSYSLRHESGEHDDGFYPITYGSAQQNGSAITYARRYCLGAVTGIAPAEDDDGAEAQRARSAGDAWDNAVPAAARNRRTEQAGGNGQPAGDPWETAAPRTQQAPAAANVQDDMLGTWAAKIDEITSTEDGERVLAELEGSRSIMASNKYVAIKGAIKAKVASVGGAQQGPHRAAGPPAEERGAVAVPTGKGDDGEWVQGFLARLAEATEDGLSALQAQVGNAVRQKMISPAKSADLSKAIGARRKELQSVPA